MVKAFFPGTFDPITLGHTDLVTRAARIFDELVVGIYAKSGKNTMFSPKQRLDMAHAELRDTPNVQVVTYERLTVNVALELKAQVIVRGLRIGGDFEYERGMALVNRTINEKVETVCLMSAASYQHISSSRVKEIATLGGAISTMVSERVAELVTEAVQER